MGKKELTTTALNLEYEIYVVHIVSLSSTPLIASLGSTPFNVHLSQRPYISGLITKKALTKVPNKYVNFADIFYLDLKSELPKHTWINDYTIELVDSQQPSYGPIYSLEPVVLETLKAYIETNLANSFIKLSKSSASTPILFDRKLDGSFRLCVNYRGLNNLTIKNRYLLSLVQELLDRLGRAR